MPPASRASYLPDGACGAVALRTARAPRARRQVLARAALSALATLAALATLLAGSCGARDALVGAAPGRDAAADAPTPLYSSQMGANAGAWSVQTILAGASAVFGTGSANASDGLVATLRFPGDASDAAGPADATEISTKQYFRFGTFRSRVQFARCAPGEEIASAAFMFFNDGSDRNANGIADNPELDLQVLCGTPTFVVLTAWADFQQAPGGAETFLKLSHAIDTATGDVYDALSAGERAFTLTGNDPALVEAGFPALDAFYEVGIEWLPARVRFFIVRDGAEVTLWEVTDTQYIPQVPLPLMFNLWHPASHWLPSATPADYPANDAVMNVDWVQFLAP